MKKDFTFLTLIAIICIPFWIIPYMLSLLVRIIYLETVELLVTSDEIDETTIKLILEKAGLEKGIGAWRAGGHGRFEIVELKKLA